VEHHRPRESLSSRFHRLRRHSRCRPDQDCYPGSGSCPCGTLKYFESVVGAGIGAGRPNLAAPAAKGFVGVRSGSCAVRPAGVTRSLRGQFLNQIGNRVVRSGIWLLWPVPLFLFCRAARCPAGPDEATVVAEVCRGWNWQPSALGKGAPAVFG
jgi:hypothetical protein